MDKSPHTIAVNNATSDMHRVISSFTDAPFMSDPVTPRQRLFESMAPDLKTLLDGGMPQYLVEKLAQADKEP